ncbi:DUF4197 domain-containing protein [Pseudodesulfovibrio indicus]|uniref:DUF4197 domain-containing protein n=1 Tax=Pseudodesulfovibrio indicus TaxID=1716143 RepID=UPI002931C5BA|nr:DUF4197 domain-containing protein [Pseudodesulfovibrio indicus]
MSLKNVIPLLLVLAAALTPVSAHAGWGDALKQAGDAGSQAMGLSVGPSQIETAFRELLVMGTDSAVESLSADGGFSRKAATALSLPEGYHKIAETVAPNLLASLNSAAEDAVPEVGALFRKTIETMEFSNPGSLLSGNKTAVTEYFDANARDSLTRGAAPLVEAALNQAGGASILSAVKQLSGLTGTPFDPVDYLTRKTLDSMFLYIGKTEKGIRSGDITATTELLQTVF